MTLHLCSFSIVAAVALAGVTTREVVQGRLAVVEPSAARIALIADGEVDLRTLAVAPDAEIKQGDRELTLSELVIQVGRRITVQYTADKGQTLAREITVEPEG